MALKNLEGSRLTDFWNEESDEHFFQTPAALCQLQLLSKTCCIMLIIIFIQILLYYALYNYQYLMGSQVPPPARNPARDPVLNPVRNPIPVQVPVQVPSCSSCQGQNDLLQMTCNHHICSNCYRNQRQFDSGKIRCNRCRMLTQTRGRKKKICLFGDQQCGKSSFLKVLQRESVMPSKIHTTKIQRVLKKMHCYGELFDLELYDTRGFSEFSICQFSDLVSLRNECDGFILFFSLDKKATFDKCKQIYKVLKRKGIADSRIVLLGNKLDLEALIDCSTIMQFVGNLSISYYEMSCIRQSSLDRNQFRVKNETILQSMCQKFIQKESAPFKMTLHGKPGSGKEDLIRWLDNFRPLSNVEVHESQPLSESFQNWVQFCENKESYKGMQIIFFDAKDKAEKSADLVKKLKALFTQWKITDRQIMVVANKVNYQTFDYREYPFEFSMTDGQDYSKLWIQIVNKHDRQHMLAKIE